MIHAVTDLATGTTSSWDDEVGELIDAHPWELTGQWRRDKARRKLIYRLQYALRNGRPTDELEELLGVHVAPDA